VSSTQAQELGFLRTCMDRRFVASTRAAFEKATGLGPADYWHEAYAGGVALPPASAIGEEYAAAHGAVIFGWQAHINGCGGQPAVSDQEIAQRLDRTLAAMREKYPKARHFRILASEDGIEIAEWH
jgi:hypothetical protein